MFVVFSGFYFNKNEQVALVNVIARFPTFFPVAMRYTSMISALFFFWVTEISALTLVAL